MHAIMLFGATGRMGQSLVRALRETPQLRLCGAITSPGSIRLGQDAAIEGDLTGVTLTSDPRAGLAIAAVALDFSLATTVAANALACCEAGVPILVGATGYDGATRDALERAAKRIAVLIAPNTSVGVNVMAKLVSLATRSLGTDYEVDIAEAHHRLKRDAPSGTALALGEVVAAVRGQPLVDLAVYEHRANSEPRPPGSIGFAAVRAGDVVGEHTVWFTADGERIEITHRATDRMTFARGALRAARWLVGRPAGVYGMAQVLGL